MAFYYFDTSAFEKAAALTQQYPLKAYDAVQLAAALRARGVVAAHQFTFVCGDTTLIAAAKAEGLASENPFDHVTPEDTPGPSPVIGMPPTSPAQS